MVAQTPKAKPSEGIQQISLSQLDPNPFQPRSPIKPADVADLVDSISQVGVLQPLLVSTHDKGFVLIAGHRRLAAAKEARLKTVPCIVKDLEETDLLRYSLIENLQREDLTPLEEARSIQKLKDTLRLDHRALAALIGKSKSYVGERLALLALPDDLQQAVSEGSLSLKKASELKKIADEDVRAKLTAKAGSADLDKLKGLVDAAVSKKPKGRKTGVKWNALPALKNYAEKNKGVRLYRNRISFKFKSDDDLKEILKQVLALLD